MPPYPRSSVITGIDFDRSTLTHAATGSDQFGYTTASDGNIYVAWGDGGGFGGTNSLGRASLGVARLLGTPPSWQGINVWGGVNPLSTDRLRWERPAMASSPSSGAYIYTSVSRVCGRTTVSGNPPISADLAELGQLFNEPNGAFADPGIIQFGPDYQGSRDQYIYGYDEHFFADGLALFRVDKSKLENRADYEFFAGLDETEHLFGTRTSARCTGCSLIPTERVGRHLHLSSVPETLSPCGAPQRRQRRLGPVRRTAALGALDDCGLRKRLSGLGGVKGADGPVPVVPRTFTVSPRNG